MISRRTFVGAVTAVAAVGALGPSLTGLRGSGSARTHRSDDFARLRGSRVALRAADGTTYDTVVEDVQVTLLPACGDAPATEQVSVLFAADGEAGRYRLDGAVPGFDELQLSPVGMPGRDRRLEAVITRIV